MEKHRAYYELLDRLKAGPACPICGQVYAAMESYLNSYLEEGVTDETNWGRLKDAGGWCGRHAGQLEAKADGLAVALFYGHLLEQSVNDVARGKSKGLDALLKRTPKKASCPGCERETEAEQGQAHLLGKAAGEEEAQALMKDNLQLCVPHLTLTLGYAEGAADEFLRRDQGAKLKALRDELESFARKTGHDGRGKEPLGPEADSWKRVLKRWYGLTWGR